MFTNERKWGGIQTTETGTKIISSERNLLKLSHTNAQIKLFQIGVNKEVSDLAISAV
jgi:hypothetical protein